MWLFYMWKRVCWTDEAMFRLGGFGEVWVTRRAEEKYDPACCIPKFRHRLGLMVHGSISGLWKGLLVIFEHKEKVTAQVYSTKVPGVHQFIRWMERSLGPRKGILTEDNASVHIATYTQAWHTYFGFTEML
jgi:hypothetical protein